MQQNLKEKNEQNVASSIPVNLQGKKKQSPQTLLKYWEYFQDFRDLISKESIIQKLSKQSQVGYNEFLGSSYGFKVVSHSSNYEILELRVYLNCFWVKVTIFNKRNKSKMHHLRNHSHTRTGIFCTQFNRRKIAIKCILINENIFEKGFKRALREFSLLKIASVLRIGPYIGNNGFDMILYDGCVQFGMQEGKQIDSWTINDEIDLKKKIFSLHQLKIAHKDIKPENIMWSPHLKQAVLIDYGFSNFVEQDLGQLTFTTFAGTLNYCSDAMLKCHSERRGWVDLYYNDIHCLEGSLRVLRAKISALRHYGQQEQNPEQSHAIQVDQQFQIAAQKQLQILFVKSQLYIGVENPEKYLTLIKENESIFRQYFTTLPYSWRLLKFQLNHFIKTSSTKDHYQMLQSQQNKHRSLGTIQGKQSTDELFIDDKLSDIINGFDLNDDQKQDQESQAFYCPLNELDQLLVDKQRISKLKKSLYYDYFLRFINACNGNSSKTLKIQVSKVFIQYQGLQQQHKKSNQNALQFCLKQLVFNLMADFKYSCSHETVHILLTNILIYQILPEDSILSIYSRIFKMEVSTINKIKMIFRFYVAKYWIIQKSISKFKFTLLVSKIDEIIQVQIDKIIKSSHSHSKISKILQKIILHTKTHINGDKLLLNTIISLRQQIDDSFYYELNVFYTLVLLQKTSYLTDLPEVNEYLQNINQLLSKTYEQNGDFNSFVLLLFHCACKFNVSSIFQAFDLKFKKNECLFPFQSHFKLYYHLFYNNYISLEMKKSQFLNKFLQASIHQQYSWDETIVEVLLKFSNNRLNLKSNKSNHKFMCKLDSYFSREKLDLIPKIVAPNSCEESLWNYVSYFKTYYFNVNIIAILDPEQSITLFQIATSVLKQMLNNITCLKCKQKCKAYIDLLIADYHLYKLDTVSALKGYLSMLENLSADNKQQWVFPEICIFQVIRQCSFQQIGSPKLIFMDQLLKIIKNKQLIFLLMAPYLQIDVYQSLNCYIFLILRDADQFFLLHMRLMEFLSFFPSEGIMKVQNSIVLCLGKQCYLDMLEFNDKITIEAITILPNIHYGLQLISLFFSACLRFDERALPQFDCLLRHIFHKLKYLHPLSHSFILGNLLYYKLKCIYLAAVRTNRNSNYPRSKIPSIERHLSYFFKCYVKRDLFSLEYSDFLAMFLNNFSPRKNLYNDRFKSYVHKYYCNLQEGNSRLIDQLGDHYFYRTPFRYIPNE